MRKQLAIIVWSAMVAAACAGHRPAVVAPSAPVVVASVPVVAAPSVATLAVIAADQVGAPIAGAEVVLEPSGVAMAATNPDGYTAAEQVLGAYRVTVRAAGFVPSSVEVALSENRDVRVSLARERPRPATEAELHEIRANFCNLIDGRGRVVFTPFYISLSAAERAEWLELQRREGATHFVISPAIDYPGSAIAPRDLSREPETFARYVRELLDTPSASGAGFTPILILDDGAAGFRARVDALWPAIRAALGDDVARVIVVPGWELVKASTVTSAEFAYSLEKLHTLGFPHIWAHLSPNRASASSNPLESDDPWQGAESGMWKSHGGEFVEGLLYQSEAVRPGDEKCNPADGDCWLNRWADVVPRIMGRPEIGRGMNGWRAMYLAYFEGPAYYFFRGQADSNFARVIAEKALAMCRDFGAACGFGNGLPLSWGIR